MIICIDSRIVFYFYIQVTRYADSARDESMANNNNRQVVSNLVQYENVLELSLMALLLRRSQICYCDRRCQSMAGMDGATT